MDWFKNILTWKTGKYAIFFKQSVLVLEMSYGTKQLEFANKCRVSGALSAFTHMQRNPVSYVSLASSGRKRPALAKQRNIRWPAQ